VATLSSPDAGTRSAAAEALLQVPAALLRS